MEQEDDLEFDEYRTTTIYISNPMYPHLDRVLKKKGRRPLYMPYPVRGKEYKVPYQNKQDFRELMNLDIDTVFSTKFDELSSGAAKMLIYIMRELQPRTDHIVLHRDRFIREKGYQIGMYYKCVRELIDGEWIFKSPDKNVYWINILRFTRGTPIDTYKKHELNIGKEKLIVPKI